MKSIPLQISQVGPLLFVIVFTIAGASRSDYSSVRMPVSALSLGPSGWIQILNFLAVGISFIIFSFALLPIAKYHNWSRILPILLFLVGCLLAFRVCLPWTLRILPELHGPSTAGCTNFLELQFFCSFLSAAFCLHGLYDPLASVCGALSSDGS